MTDTGPLVESGLAAEDNEAFSHHQLIMRFLIASFAV